MHGAGGAGGYARKILELHFKPRPFRYDLVVKRIQNSQASSKALISAYNKAIGLTVLALP